MWVAAAALAATQVLLGGPAPDRVSLQIPDESELRSVPVRAASCLRDGAQALAISVCEPGPGLDLTRGLEIWVHACWGSADQGWLTLKAGVGVGRLETDGSLCISGFARTLLESNLRDLVPDGRALQLEVVLPKGRSLAQRTSNAAFGVVEGLALIGTQAEVQASASPDQLQAALDQLQSLTGSSDFQGRLTLVIGENGLDLARSLQLSAHQPQLKAGNWMGPLLVAAAEAGVRDLERQIGSVCRSIAATVPATYTKTLNKSRKRPSFPSSVPIRLCKPETSPTIFSKPSIESSRPKSSCSPASSSRSRATHA